MLGRILLVVGVALLAPRVYDILLMSGVGVKFYQTYPGKCSVVPGVEKGAEKIISTDDGLAFFSSGFKDLTHCNKKFLTGKLYLFDLNNPEKGVLDLVLKSETIKVSEFDPHGMDLIEQGKLVKLYVINHANERESVEVFVFNRDTPTYLQHVRTITDSNFRCLNDITLLDEENFYVTNYVKYCSGANMFLKIYENVMALRTADIVYYKSGVTTIVAKEFPCLNGLGLSLDRSKIFSVSCSTPNVFVFDRTAENTLNHVSTIGTVYSGDNVHVDKQTGDLYVATFKTKMLVLLAGKNLTTNGATGIRIAAPPSDADWNSAEVTELFHDNGGMVYSASMFLHQRKKYLIGSVHNTLVYCDDN